MYYNIQIIFYGVCIYLSVRDTYHRTTRDLAWGAQFFADECGTQEPQIKNKHKHTHGIHLMMLLLLYYYCITSKL